MALVGLLSACSLLVEGESTPLACSQEGQVGPPVCDAGLVCRAGLCQEPEPVSGAGAPNGSAADGDGGADALPEGDASAGAGYRRR